MRSFIASLPGDTVVVSGGAEGVDRWAIEIGDSLGLKTLVFHAAWEQLGRKAGPIRNAQLVAAIDELAAFWDLRLVSLASRDAGREVGHDRRARFPANASA